MLPWLLFWVVILRQNQTEVTASVHIGRVFSHRNYDVNKEAEAEPWSPSIRSRQGCCKQRIQRFFSSAGTCRGGALFDSVPRQREEYSTGVTSHLPVDLGTTVVAIRYRDGVVICADTHTSIGSQYVSHRCASKIVPVTDYCVIGRSGSAADTQYMARTVSDFFRQRNQFQYHDPFEHSQPDVNVAQVANILRSMVYQHHNSDNGGTVSLLVAGYDTRGNNGEIWSVSPSGAVVYEDSFAVTGSGSVYVLGYLDHVFRELAAENNSSPVWTLLDEQMAIHHGQRAASLAMNRDASSGGRIRTFVLNAQGCHSFCD
jgi:20S proteasome subunit beta 1